jgi:hypothetical protein
MNKQSFELGFIKAAMAEGLNYVEASALYKTADGLNDGSRLVHSLMTQQAQNGGSDDLLNQALLGGAAGALGGGALGALSADGEKGQSKWKRGFGGALAGGGLGALAGGGMKLNDQFNQAKDTAHSLLVDAGRSNLPRLHNPGNFEPMPGAPPLNDPNQNIRAFREIDEQARNASLLQNLLHPTYK